MTLAWTKMTSQEFKNLLKDDHHEHFCHIFDLQEMAPMKTWGGTQRGTSRREQNLISPLCEMKMKSSSPVVRPAEAGRGSPRMPSSSPYDRQPAGVFPPSVRFRLNNSELFQTRGSPTPSSFSRTTCQGGEGKGEDHKCGSS